MRFSILTTLLIGLSGISSVSAVPTTALSALSELPAVPEYSVEKANTNTVDANGTFSAERLATLAVLEDTLAKLPPTTSASTLDKIFTTFEAGNSGNRGPSILGCLTTSTSPPIVHTHYAANKLIANTEPSWKCTQHFTNACTRVTFRYDADIFQCWGNGTAGLKCHTVAWAAKHIANSCRNSNGQAMGYYIFEVANIRVSVA